MLDTFHVTRKIIHSSELLPKGKKAVLKTVCLLPPDSVPCVGSLLVVGTWGIQGRTGARQCHQDEHHHHMSWM